MGLRLDDLDSLEQGTIISMMVESSNDDFSYKPVATQEDMDRF